MAQSNIPMDKIPETIALRKAFVITTFSILELETIAMDREEIAKLFADLRRHIDALEADIIKLHHGF